jgi:hypothetical protein
MKKALQRHYETIVKPWLDRGGNLNDEFAYSIPRFVHAILDEHAMHPYIDLYDFQTSLGQNHEAFTAVVQEYAEIDGLIATLESHESWDDIRNQGFHLLCRVTTLRNALDFLTFHQKLKMIWIDLTLMLIRGNGSFRHDHHMIKEMLSEIEQNNPLHPSRHLWEEAL